MAGLSTLIGLGLAGAGVASASRAAGQAQGDIRRGRGASLNALLTGYNTAGGALDTARDTATGYINPFIATGGRYQAMYDDLMGLNGPEARARAQAVITSDPLWTGALGQQQNAAFRALNARGMSGSGTAALAAQRVLNENYQPVLTRYQQGGQMGMAASGAAADIASRYGSERANLDFGYGQQVAGVHQTSANAMAGTRGLVPNAILGGAGMFTAGMTPGLGGTSAFGALANGLTSGWNRLWGAGAQPNLSNFTGYGADGAYF